MRNHSAGTRWLLGLVLLATMVSARVDAKPTQPVVPQVNLLQLEGHLRDPQPTDKGTTDLRLGHAGKTYRLQLTELRVLTGPSRLPADILANVAPHRPSFVLTGADAMVQRLDGSKPDAGVRIVGYLQRGSRQLLVTEITVTPSQPAPQP
jgi:hypothetical protein